MELLALIIIIFLSHIYGNSSLHHNPLSIFLHGPVLHSVPWANFRTSRWRCQPGLGNQETVCSVAAPSPFPLQALPGVAPTSRARLALGRILPVISVWQTTPLGFQNFRALRGTDNKLFSAHCAKSAAGRRTEEGYCCRWPLSPPATALGRWASPSPWCAHGALDSR